MRQAHQPDPFRFVVADPEPGGTLHDEERGLSQAVLQHRDVHGVAAAGQSQAAVLYLERDPLAGTRGDVDPLPIGARAV